VCGFAAGKKIIGADEWLTARGKEIDTRENVIAKIVGTVRSGELELAQELLNIGLRKTGQDLLGLADLSDDLNHFPHNHPIAEKAKISIAEYQQQLNQLVYSLGRTGHFTLAVNIFCLKEKDPNQIFTTLLWTIQGAGRGGYYSEALEYIATLKDKAMQLNFKDGLLTGLARGGALKEVNQILPLLQESETLYFSSSIEIIKKYAAAGYFTKALAFIGDHPDHELELTRIFLCHLNANMNLSHTSYRNSIADLVKTYSNKISAEGISTTSGLYSLPSALQELVTAPTLEEKPEPVRQTNSRYSFQARDRNVGITAAESSHEVEIARGPGHH
jgi:hypothetical protein